MIFNKSGAHYNNIINRADGEKQKIMEKYGYSFDIAEYNTFFQAKQDALDVLINLFNNSTANETIEFINT